MGETLIHVEFVDASNAKIFGVYDAPPDTLPADFNVGTMLPLESMIELMKTYRLYLVEWCRVVVNTHNEVVQYLRKMGL